MDLSSYFYDVIQGRVERITAKDSYKSNEYLITTAGSPQKVIEVQNCLEMKTTFVSDGHVRRLIPGEN